MRTRYSDAMERAYQRGFHAAQRAMQQAEQRRRYYPDPSAAMEWEEYTPPKYVYDTHQYPSRHHDFYGEPSLPLFASYPPHLVAPAYSELYRHERSRNNPRYAPPPYPGNYPQRTSRWREPSHDLEEHLSYEHMRQRPYPAQDHEIYERMRSSHFPPPNEYTRYIRDRNGYLSPLTPEITIHEPRHHRYYQPPHQTEYYIGSERQRRDDLEYKAEQKALRHQEQEHIRSRNARATQPPQPAHRSGPAVNQTHRVLPQGRVQSLIHRPVRSAQPQRHTSPAQTSQQPPYSPVRRYVKPLNSQRLPQAQPLSAENLRQHNLRMGSNSPIENVKRSVAGSAAAPTQKSPAPSIYSNASAVPQTTTPWIKQQAAASARYRADHRIPQLQNPMSAPLPLSSMRTSARTKFEQLPLQISNHGSIHRTSIGTRLHSGIVAPEEAKKLALTKGMQVISPSPSDSSKSSRSPAVSGGSTDSYKLGAAQAPSAIGTLANFYNQYISHPHTAKATLSMALTADSKNPKGKKWHTALMEFAAELAEFTLYASDKEGDQYYYKDWTLDQILEKLDPTCFCEEAKYHITAYVAELYYNLSKKRSISPTPSRSSSPSLMPLPQDLEPNYDLFKKRFSELRKFTANEELQKYAVPEFTKLTNQAADMLAATITPSLTELQDPTTTTLDTKKAQAAYTAMSETKRKGVLERVAYTNQQYAHIKGLNSEEDPRARLNVASSLGLGGRTYMSFENERQCNEYLEYVYGGDFTDSGGRIYEFANPVTQQTINGEEYDIITSKKGTSYAISKIENEVGYSYHLHTINPDDTLNKSVTYKLDYHCGIFPLDKKGKVAKKPIDEIEAKKILNLHNSARTTSETALGKKERSWVFRRKTSTHTVDNTTGEESKDFLAGVFKLAGIDANDVGMNLALGGASNKSQHYTHQEDGKNINEPYIERNRKALTKVFYNRAKDTAKQLGIILPHLKEDAFTPEQIIPLLAHIRSKTGEQLSLAQQLEEDFLACCYFQDSTNIPKAVADGSHGHMLLYHGKEVILIGIENCEFGKGKHDIFGKIGEVSAFLVKLKLSNAYKNPKYAAHIQLPKNLGDLRVNIDQDRLQALKKEAKETNGNPLLYQALLNQFLVRDMEETDAKNLLAQLLQKSKTTKTPLTYLAFKKLKETYPQDSLTEQSFLQTITILIKEQTLQSIGQEITDYKTEKTKDYRKDFEHYGQDGNLRIFQLDDECISRAKDLEKIDKKQGKYYLNQVKMLLKNLDQTSPASIAITEKKLEAIMTLLDSKEPKQIENHKYLEKLYRRCEIEALKELFIKFYGFPLTFDAIEDSPKTQKQLLQKLSAYITVYSSLETNKNLLRTFVELNSKLTPTENPEDKIKTEKHITDLTKTIEKEVKKQDQITAEIRKICDHYKCIDSTKTLLKQGSNHSLESRSSSPSSERSPSQESSEWQKKISERRSVSPTNSYGLE